MYAHDFRTSIARNVMSERLPMGVETRYNIKESVAEKKVAPRFELGMEALQASALPLGYATLAERDFLYRKRNYVVKPKNEKKSFITKKYFTA